MEQNSEGGQNLRSGLYRLWTKVHEILRQCRRPLVLSSARARLSMSRFIEKIIAIKSRSRRNPNKCKTFWARIFTTPIVLRQIVSVICRPPFGKVWLSSVCWSPSEKPCRIYEGWVNAGPIFGRFWTKVHVVCRRYRGPLPVVNALARLSISCFRPGR